MTIREHLNSNDLKLTGYGNMNEEQKKVWDEAYGEKNRAYEAAKDSMTDEEIVKWKYQRYVKDYLRCVKSVDDGIGEVLDFLDEAGLTENTIVMYSSDQGWYLGEHGWFDKRWMYEESLRTPLLARWPGVISPGSTNNDIVSNLDFAETFLDLAGVDVHPICKVAHSCRLSKVKLRVIGAKSSTTTTTRIRVPTTWHDTMASRTEITN